MIKGITIQTKSKKKSKFNYRKLAIGAGILLLGLVLWQSVGVTKKMLEEINKDKALETTPSINLPEGWKGANENKFQKEEEGYKPTVAVAVSTKDNTKSNQAYIDSLIAGLKTTIPSMRIAKNEKITQDNMEGRKLTGYYFNGKTKVNVIQKILIVDTKVFTATGTYVTGEEKEIETVVDNAIDEKMKIN